jgi:hypothetical protein
MIPSTVKRIMGVSRSGMFAAGILAERFHVPLWSISQQTGPIDLGHGVRLDKVEEEGLTVVVDDTVAAGYSFAQLKPLLLPNSLFYCLYCSPECRNLVTGFAELLSLPHYLEWNIFNSVHTPSLATDIDGILCPDPPESFLDKEQECPYEKWLIRAPILQRPLRDTIPLIATGRRRRYRRQTESWLETCGICYDQLVFPQTEEEYLNPGKMKAEAYGKSPATIFIESNQKQARLIARLTGKRVICPASQEVLN